jgi:hypothetical protein
MVIIGYRDDDKMNILGVKNNESLINTLFMLSSSSLSLMRVFVVKEKHRSAGG